MKEIHDQLDYQPLLNAKPLTAPSRGPAPEIGASTPEPPVGRRLSGLVEDLAT